MPNEWSSASHALAYLDRQDRVPHRTEGEAVLLEFLPARTGRILDLGCGDGRLAALALLARPGADAVCVDFSPAMLDACRERFAGDGRVTVVGHDLSEPIPDLGPFDVVVSSFAIHHLEHDRKHELYREVFALLPPGGVFLNLEHVTPATERLHSRFLTALGITPDEEDPSNILLDVGTQLAWLREIGFADVDCHWKWLELALIGGAVPA